LWHIGIPAVNVQKYVPRRINISSESLQLSSLTGPYPVTTLLEARPLLVDGRSLPGGSTLLVNTLSVLENTMDVRTSLTINTGGRPAGSTNVAKRAKTSTIRLALTEAAQLYASEKKIAEACGKCSVPDGTLAIIIDSLESKYNLEASTLCKSSIHNHVLWESYIGEAHQRISP
jgi:hypothetical protein